ncbi:hypothetical protein ACF0H5_011933 [Mactra antiquata]
MVMDKYHPEAILEEIGGCGSFQIHLSILSHFMKLPTLFSMLLMVFSTASPKWECADDKNILIGNSTWEKTERLHVYNRTYNDNVNVTMGKSFPRYNISIEHVNYDNRNNCENRNGTRCSTIKYGTEMNTIVTEWSMACEMSWIPSTIASVQMCGILIGNLVSGQLADSFGRKSPWLGSQIILIIANLIAYFSTSWLMFGCARAICGFGMGVFLTVEYTLITEVSVSKWRPWIIAAPSWPLLCCVYSLVNFLLPDWRKMHLLTAMLTVPFIIAAWFMPESFRWYLSHDRQNNAKDIITMIAKRNKHPINDETLDELLDLQKEHVINTDRKYTVLQLFTPRLIKTTLLSMVNWLALGLLSYGIQYGIQALSGNLFMNLFLFSVIIIPATLIAIGLCNWIGRRRTVILTYFVAFLGCLIVGIVQNIETDLKGPLTNGFAMFASLGIGVAWGPVQLVILELYPTVVRSIGNGYLNTIARLGAVIGPQLAYLNTRVPGVMYFICAGVGLCCIIGTLLLPETKGVALEDKIKTNKVIDQPDNDVV